MQRHRWYLSAAAVRQYLTLAGLADDDGGPIWAQAEAELGAHCEAARLVADEGHRHLYRTGRVRIGARPKADRLELTVSTAARSEGSLYQLVAVRLKGGGGRDANRRHRAASGR